VCVCVWNNACEVNSKVKVNLWLANPWVTLHVEQPAFIVSNLLKTFVLYGVFIAALIIVFVPDFRLSRVHALCLNAFRYNVYMITFLTLTMLWLSLEFQLIWWLRGTLHIRFGLIWFSLLIYGMSQIYRGYVDDPRNTDNAWMETVAYHFHDDDGTSVGQFHLHAGKHSRAFTNMSLTLYTVGH